MAIKDDDRDDETTQPERFMELPRWELGCLMTQTGEEIDFEDHGDVVVVCSEDLERLRRLAFVESIYDQADYE